MCDAAIIFSTSDTSHDGHLANLCNDANIPVLVTNPFQHHVYHAMVAFSSFCPPDLLFIGGDNENISPGVTSRVAVLIELFLAESET